MVFTSSFAKYTIAVVTIIATSEPGILSVTLGQMSMIATATNPITVAVTLIVPMCFP